MIFVDSTYWPLVVIGPVKAAAARLPLAAGPAKPQGAELARLGSREPRAVALVVPGHGDEAAGALETLLAWLRDVDAAATGNSTVLGPATRLAWVAPDRTLRATLDAMLTDQGQRAFGCPSTTFSALLPALLWLVEAVKKGTVRRPPPSFRHVLGSGR